MIDGFSIPFFAAAVLGLCTLAAAMRWLPESLSTQAPRSRSEEVGAVFVVCGLVMAVFQVGASGLLAGRVSEMGQIGMGFVLMGTSLAVLMMPRRTLSVLALVGLLALGMALIAPNLAALISKRGGSRRAGTALGAQNAANSLGQASDPLVGGALFVWQMNAPYVLSGGVLVAIALIIGWKALCGRRAATLAS